MLGIPSDPELVPPTVNASPAAVEAGPLRDTMLPGASPDPTVTPGGVEGGRDGVLPARGVTGIAVDAGESWAPGPTNAGLDAGSGRGTDAGAPVLGCAEPASRALVDVIFALDNSGSMAEECGEFERALPGFAARLSSAGVDYRIILVSRHRQDERDSSDQASTSVCVAAPLSGLASCPSERPVLGERFFQHSIKLDASDSLERLLEAFSEPDPFELTPSGWSAWLRPAARRIFIEITDADSDLSASEFESELAAASPELFGGAQSFVFHAILGIATKAADGGVYAPHEPIELAQCSGEGSSIDSAGPVYQELSRATGGLRLSICPPSALTQGLEVLADDTIARSALGCAG